MSGVSASPLLMEFGVDEGVVDDGKTLETASVSNFTGVLVLKSKPRLIDAVVSVAWKQTSSALINKHSHDNSKRRAYGWSRR